MAKLCQGDGTETSQNYNTLIREFCLFLKFVRFD